MKTLSIDIETYSSAELAKCGVYKYTEAPDFEILLFGYSVDGGPVKVVDLAMGETIPPEVIFALTDDSVTKWAFNAQFERVCLSRWLRVHGSFDNGSYCMPGDTVGNYLNPVSWRCTMIWSAYMGLPLSLEGVGAVLGLEKQKLTEGKDLIKYFCQPCAPTKSNGGRTRNLPKDAPEKWATFKKYNIRDVEVELSIQRKLAKFPVPDMVWDQYHLDQKINDRGVKLDMVLVRQAIDMDTRSRAELTEAMKNLTALENPNSVQQMKQWLSDNGVDASSLGKKEVSEMVKTAPPELKSVLLLRQQLAKSSVKKYQAMEKAVCADGRARGMFQFYGANRTGRWCLTGDHEVLTRDGWQRLDKWEGGPIACWNCSTEAVSFQKAQRVSFPYNGPMYTYQDNRIDQCSTPDHKMRVQKRYDSDWQDMTVEEMSHCRPVIPLMGYRYHRGCANPTWIRVLIMVQADGHYYDEGTIRFCFKKLRKVERCKHLLRRAEIPFVCQKYKDDITAITIPARAVPLWLRQFREKTFGFWLLDENPDIFFDELPNWDGYHCGPNSIQYTTCNKQNADIVQALAHMSGRTARMHIKKHGPEHPNWKDAYILDIWLTPKNSHEIRTKPKVEEFSGTVYCAATETGYFLVRRNGKVWVTGNSGRIIQMQNLPQNHLPDLAEARALVRCGNYDGVKMLYEDVPDTLSQLIRTAFIPKPGCRFIVSDFSAIEARVLAWLAGETWRQKVFEEGRDIYCESASRMFKVPVEKHGQNSHLRQKGKQAELACIAEGQLVLTNRGLIPIESVSTDDLLWDGESWVRHEGVIFKGEREVITYEGLTATEDHLVWVQGQSQPVQFGLAASCGFHLQRSGEPTPEQKFHPSRARVYDILNVGKHNRFTVSGKLVHNCGYGGSVGALKNMGALELGLTEDELQPLVDMWRESNPNITAYWWDVDSAAKKAIEERLPQRVGDIKFMAHSGMFFITLPSGRCLAYAKPRLEANRFGSESITYEGIGGTKKWERLETYGPKLVENIVQAIARDILCHAMQTLSQSFITMHIHDELVIEAGPEVELKTICEQMGKTPSWASGLKLRADGYETPFYKKD